MKSDIKEEDFLFGFVLGGFFFSSVQAHSLTHKRLFRRKIMIVWCFTLRTYFARFVEYQRPNDDFTSDFSSSWLGFFLLLALKHMLPQARVYLFFNRLATLEDFQKRVRRGGKVGSEWKFDKTPSVSPQMFPSSQMLLQMVARDILAKNDISIVAPAVSW